MSDVTVPALHGPLLSPGVLSPSPASRSRPGSMGGNGVQVNQDVDIFLIDPFPSQKRSRAELRGRRVSPWSAEFRWQGAGGVTEPCPSLWEAS